MKRWHTYNRRKKRHVPKDLWRFMDAAKRVMARQDSHLAWHLHNALVNAVHDTASIPRPEDEQRETIAEVLDGFRGSMVNAVLAKATWDLVYTEVGQEKLAALNRHFNA